MTHPIIIGWPTTFQLKGAPECEIVVTKFFISAPVQDFIRLEAFRTSRTQTVEFCSLEWPFLPIARLPGKPVDPWQWFNDGVHYTRLAPLRIGPKHEAQDVRLRVHYTGAAAPGLKPGERFKITALFIGTRD